MNPERWRQIEELYHTAREHEPGKRALFLADACGDDPDLRREIEFLLAQDFGDTPASDPLGDSAATQSDASIGRDSFGAEGKKGPDSARTATIPTQAAGDPTSQPRDFVGMFLERRYRVIKQLGSGGFATVYLAHDERLASKPVVIKVLHNLTADQWLLRKFRQEMEALARIDHPGVIAVLDEGHSPQGAPFLVIQFVDGVTLRRLVQPGGIEFARAAEILRQVGSSLQAAHEKGVCHRDLTPENIMIQGLDGKDRVKLIDFGIAGIADSRYASAGQLTPIAGTRGYMAPEQLEGKACPESDIYAFGVIAYELLTGQKPVKSPMEMVATRPRVLKIKMRELRPEVPASTQEIILKSLSLEVNKRYHNAREMGDLLAEALLL